jgi:hypothetical protein
MHTLILDQGKGRKEVILIFKRNSMIKRNRLPSMVGSTGQLHDSERDVI